MRFQERIARALEIPANNRTGTINDVEHIVFMMQENRSLIIISGPFVAASQAKRGQPLSVGN